MKGSIDGLPFRFEGVEYFVPNMSFADIVEGRVIELPDGRYFRHCWTRTPKLGIPTIEELSRFSNEEIYEIFRGIDPLRATYALGGNEDMEVMIPISSILGT